ncbi:hypothetical protein W97_09121 [Coniosporium apollinis CBS 100218]|uniref:Uncharacterized protein n=1 Tax=Coniosporium apollinis (strain CBS 100218) TaxID=1168221 RepID=R7Z6X2_CONA1|nr:uncharacterized protein W97_09121 [Coniosporium apollinis CBS 100218]EON69858.1 hypothetical protein W97_09121 [Coniosporium apollinis CBS 100218]
MIYEYALISSDNAIRITQGRDPQPPPWPKARPAVNLLRTCSQIYQEAVDVFYEGNTVYVFCDLQDRSRSIISEDAIPVAALARIRSLFVVLWAAPLDSYYLGNDGWSPEDFSRRVSMGPFSYLWRLRDLRLSLLSRYPIRDPISFASQKRFCGDVLLGFVEWVPGHCKIEYGAKSDAELGFVKIFEEVATTPFFVDQELPGEIWEDLAKDLCLAQGRQWSGTDWHNVEQSQQSGRLEEENVWLNSSYI